MPTNPPNYFASAEVAARYAKVRPLYHDEVAVRVLAFAGLERFERALDVGCGSGHSSIAWADVCRNVIAIDPSQSMLDQAPARTNLRYQIGAAEELDFGAEEFDLISVGSALHWFDQRRFYSECKRVLQVAGLLVVYNDHFTAHMEGTVACKRWMRTRFAKRFPAPLRGMRDMDEAQAAAGGFEVALRSGFSHVVPFSRMEFIAYLLTRSNTLAAIQNGRETHSSVVDWLDSELSPIVPDGVTGQFIFKCNVWMMHKAAVTLTSPSSANAAAEG